MQRNAPMPTSTSTVGLGAVLVPQPVAWSAAGLTAHEVQLASRNRCQQQPLPSAPLSLAAAQHGTAAAAGSVTIEIHARPTSSDGKGSPETSATPSVSTDMQAAEIHGQRGQFAGAARLRVDGQDQHSSRKGKSHSVRFGSFFAQVKPHTPGDQQLTKPQHGSLSHSCAIPSRGSPCRYCQYGSITEDHSQHQQEPSGPSLGLVAASQQLSPVTHSDPALAADTTSQQHPEVSPATVEQDAAPSVQYGQESAGAGALDPTQATNAPYAATPPLLHIPGRAASTSSSTTGALTAATASLSAATATETAASRSSTDTGAQTGTGVAAAATVVPQHVDLLKEKTDVYACAVRGLLHCKRSTALHMWAAMIVICFVQITLLVLLLQGARSPAAGTKSPVPNNMSTDQQLKVLLVILLSMGTLSVFVICEAMQAMQLAYVVAASAGVLPIQFTSPEHRGNVVAAFAQRWRVMLAYPIPLLQMVVAVLAFCTAGSIRPMPEFLDDITQVIINSVALAFVIEIDDKAGDVLAWTLRFNNKRVLLDQQYCTCAAIGFNTRRDAERQVPICETRVITDWRSLYMYTGRSFAWAVLQVPLVMLVAALLGMAQFFSYTHYGHILEPTEFASKPQGPLAVAGFPTATVASSCGNYFERLILLLLFVVLLIDQPLIVPQYDAWLDVFVNNCTVNTLVGPRSYMLLCRRCALRSWLWYLFNTCVLYVLYPVLLTLTGRWTTGVVVINNAAAVLIGLTCFGALSSHRVLWFYQRVVWHWFDTHKSEWIRAWHMWSTRSQANSPISWWRRTLLTPLMLVRFTAQLCWGFILALVSIIGELFYGIPGILCLLVQTLRPGSACCPCCAQNPDFLTDSGTDGDRVQNN